MVCHVLRLAHIHFGYRIMKQKKRIRKEKRNLHVSIPPQIKQAIEIMALTGGGLSMTVTEILKRDEEVKKTIKKLLH